MSNEDLRYRIMIGLVPKIGPVLTKRLIAYCGSIEGIFREKRKNLAKIQGIGEKHIECIVKFKNSDVIDREIDFITKNNIAPVFYLDDDYPPRLKQCEDAPVMIYTQGPAALNRPKVLSIVGTRSATDYGKRVTDELVQALAGRFPDVLVVSGLAYGIDIHAHRSALRYNVDTAAVLGHGLAFTYPQVHGNTAREIAERGLLISEFMHDERPESPNFIKRNRIIAGLSDATIVVESGKEGGALITADIAGSYNRDVFTFPGRKDDRYSRGCNNLIKTNQAALIEDLDDIEYLLGWESRSKPAVIQREMFVELDQDETLLMSLLRENGKITIDQMARSSRLPVSKISARLLNMEFKGLVRCLPGKIYEAVN
jgi:DNA processing protein